MKAYLLLTATLFALFSGFHFVIAWEHARAAGATLSAGAAPVVIGIAAAGLAAWGFRLTRSGAGPAV